MRALLDVNVLIALLDADHSLHDRAIDWFDGHAASGWASCQMTQNGCVRIMSHPAYPNAPPVAAVVKRLSAATAGRYHEFWADDVSLLDPALVDPQRVHGARQLTDVYLVALAVRHSGRLVTFDDSISITSVKSAKAAHLVSL